MSEGTEVPIRRLTTSVSWISESFALPDGRLEHVSVYLIQAEDGTILVDSGSFHHRESLRSRIEAATAGAGIGALVLSHSDYPHSGNLRAFLRHWGDFEIVASCGDPATQGLPHARRSRIGEALDVLGRRLRFLDPPLADRSHTTWIYDEADRVLFVADGFGAYHRPGEAAFTSGDYEDGIPLEAIHDFHRDTLVWLRYADPPRLIGTLERILGENPVRWIAPIHGPPIASADLPEYLSRLREAVSRIAGA